MSKKHYIIPIFVPHKGCPHDCVFCNQKKITGNEKDISEKDVDSIIEEYLSTIDKSNSYVELSFYGGSFTGIPIEYQNKLLNAGQKALNSKKVDALRLSTRPDYINDDILTNLKNHGVKTIELGVQSMDSEVLIASERGHTSQDVIAASKLIKEYGFNLGLQMMIGLPSDSIEKDIMTAKEIIKLKPDCVRIYPALVIKDTYMEEMMRLNLYTPLSVDEAVSISKQLLKLFIINNIRVIRIGLQPTDLINVNKAVIGGPFHPAFRELVESSLLNEMLYFILKNNCYSSNNVIIKVAPKDISKLFSNRKRFFNDIIHQFSTIKLSVQQDINLGSMNIAYSCGDTRGIMSIEQYLNLVK